MASKLPIAREIMNERIHTVSADADVASAVRVLLKRGHSGAPVVDDEGRPLGVLSEHDCIRVMAEAVAESWPTGRAADHMTSEIETVSPNDDVLALATRFAQGRHRRLLVVEDGRLIGIISRRDLLAAVSALEERLERPPKRSTYDLIDERHRELD